jgi:hypothetical protein
MEENRSLGMGCHMKKAEVRKLYSIIRSEISEYKLENKLLIRIPLGNILGGILFDSSGFSIRVKS